MEQLDPAKKLEYWREHIRRVALFEGTQSEYARQNGISAGKLSYYKGQLAPKPSFAKVIPKERVTEVRAPPKPIQENLSSDVRVPDARWLATFLKEFLR